MGTHDEFDLDVRLTGGRNMEEYGPARTDLTADQITCQTCATQCNQDTCSGDQCAPGTQGGDGCAPNTQGDGCTPTPNRTCNTCVGNTCEFCTIGNCP